MGNAPGSEQELSRRRNDSCSQYPDRRLGYEQFSGFIGSTRATAAHGPRPTGRWHRTDKSGKRKCLHWQRKGLNVCCDACRSGGIRT